MASHAAMLLDPRAYKRQMQANGNDPESSPLPISDGTVAARASSEPPASLISRPLTLASPRDDDTTGSEVNDQFRSPLKGTTQQDSSSPRDTATPASTASVARQLLSPRDQLSSSRTKSTSNRPPASSSNATLSAQNESRARPDLEFEFVGKDATNDVEEEAASDRKRSFEQVDADAVGGGHRRLIENMYGVERREDQPQKRVKTAEDQEEKVAAGKKGNFAISGNSGLGEWMKEDKGRSDTPSTATPNVVDLTIGEDVTLGVNSLKWFTLANTHRLYRFHACCYYSSQRRRRLASHGVDQSEYSKGLLWENRARHDPSTHGAEAGY